MRKRAPEPSLEGALRAALLARLPRLPEAAVAPHAFRTAIENFERADARYRAAIEKGLSRANAREVLAATEAFRRSVRTVRAAAATEAAGLSAGSDLDLLDVVTPRTPGLTHVAAVRLASLGDNARAQVATLRAQANARIAPLLMDRTRAALIEAKRLRMEAFRGAVHAALVPLGAQVERFSETVDSLATVADGWY